MTFPEHLYHYTSQEGLFGILDVFSPTPKPRLWMTNILYLNDSSEYKYTLELVKSEVRKRKNEIVNHLREMVDCTYRVYDYVEKYCDDFPDDTLYEFCIFSLSQKPDDLNQWRGYCPKGGFSIGFDYKKLSSIINNYTEYRIEECKYHLEETQGLVKSVLDSIPSIFESNKKSSLSEVSSKILNEIIKLSPYIKHVSFKNENEYRIIHENNYNDERKYRYGKSMIVPYVEFSPLDEDGKLPISEIIVGPTPHSELSKRSVQCLLNSKGYDIEVKTSQIPYLSW